MTINTPISNEKRRLNELTSDDVRRIGIALNGGKSYGWRDRMAGLTGASAYTIRSWADNETSASRRPCSGPSALLLQIFSTLNAANVDVDALLIEVAESFPAAENVPECAKSSTGT